MEERKRYSAEFKREAVRRLEIGDTPAATVAREPGIPQPDPGHALVCDP
jgi:transposase